MTTIRMETEDVRGAARKIDYAVQELSFKPRRLRSAASSLKSAWSSRQASHYAAELKKLAKILEVEVAELQQLAQRMRNEVAEWEAEGASFDLDLFAIKEPASPTGMTMIASLSAGALGAGIFYNINENIKPVLDYMIAHGAGPMTPGSGSSPTGLPLLLVNRGEGSMSDVAKRLDNMYPKTTNTLGEVLFPDYTPVCVYKTGPNQYAALIVGTVGGFDAGNWNSAMETGLGTPTEYEEQVRSILLSLGKDAEVTIFGHSQGGMVADVMAADQTLKDNNININRVITFGSPEVATPQDDVSYYRFRAGDDPVTGLTHRAMLEWDHKQIKIDGNPEGGRIDDHRWYDDSSDLKKWPLDKDGEPFFESFTHVKCHPPRRKSSRYYLRKMLRPQETIRDIPPNIINLKGVSERFGDWWKKRPPIPLPKASMKMNTITSSSALSPTFSSSWQVPSREESNKGKTNDE